MEGKTVQVYEPNLERIMAEARALAETLDLTLVSSSTRFVEEFVSNALWLYANLNLRKWYDALGDSVPSTFLDDGAKNYDVPTDIYNAFSELCRPMVDGDTVYLPDFMGLQRRKKDLWTMGNQYLEDLNQLYTAFDDAGLTLEPLQKQALEPVPVSVWDPVYGGLAWHDEPTQDRIQALGRLRHARFQLAPGRPAVRMKA